ncbi:hypothetical protein GEV33_001113 [Tenebrio molitor]|uniref:Uncharacterized protein n=1 Tax=Tenebrio molitor TaxID=7067 RepID=A0A8J6LJU8_TENMO|nr:hypothetical protein GEV33_001113 [Tenebrio molitor]
MEKSTFLAFLAVANLCFGAKLPTTFKKCDKKQSDFDQCLSTAVKDVLSQFNVEKKEVGLPSFEPLEVPSLAIGAGTGPVQFAQNYKDFKLSGLTKVDFLKAKLFEEAIQVLQTLTMIRMQSLFMQRPPNSSTFKKCDKKQSDFDQCLSTAVKDALSQLNVGKKEVGLPSFEPLEVPSLVIGAGKGPVGFVQNYKNIKLSGFTKVDSLKAK